MFDWFWEFLYSISSTIFRLIDGLILCANKFCGVEPVRLEGEETDFLSYLLFSEQVGFAFRVSAVLAIVLLVFFTIFSILRTITKEKVEGTPAQICTKAFKSLVTFLFVPAVMIAFIWVGNAFVQALYQATLHGSMTPGNFLFYSFAQDGGMAPEHLERFMSGADGYVYTNKDLVFSCMDISEFSFVFSWLASGVVLVSLASAMFIFADRVLSIVILYIVAPISISTAMLDDGARFKLWRDQLLTKFIMGYGMIIALNIYGLICSLVMNPAFVFFEDSSFLNLIVKLLLVGGGALTLQKSMALVGNLVAHGAGSNELRDNAFTAGGLARMAKGAAGTALGALGTATGAKFAASIFSNAAASKSRDLGDKMLSSLGFGTQNTELTEAKLAKARLFMAQNGNANGALGGRGNDAARNAILGGDNARQGNADDNHNAGQGRGNDLVNNAIRGAGFKTSDWGGGNGN